MARASNRKRLRTIGEIPQIKRGQVWCVRCGSTLRLDGLRAMQNGWPKCCGQTMTIDSPEERAAMAKRRRGVAG